MKPYATASHRPQRDEPRWQRASSFRTRDEPGAPCFQNRVYKLQNKPLPDNTLGKHGLHLRGYGCPTVRWSTGPEQGCPPRQHFAACRQRPQPRQQPRWCACRCRPRSQTRLAWAKRRSNKLVPQVDAVAPSGTTAAPKGARSAQERIRGNIDSNTVPSESVNSSTTTRKRLWANQLTRTPIRQNPAERNLRHKPHLCWQRFLQHRVGASRTDSM